MIDQRRSWPAGAAADLDAAREASRSRAPASPPVSSMPTRQTGSVLGVALFGSLAGQANAFMAGMHASLMISACLLLAAGAAIWRGATSQKEGAARLR